MKFHGKLVSVILCLMACCPSVMAETYEEALDKLPADKDRDLFDYMDIGLGFTNDILKNTSTILSGLNEGKAQDMVSGVTNVIDMCSRHTNEHRKLLLNNIEQAHTKLKSFIESGSKPADIVRMRFELAHIQVEAGMYDDAVNEIVTALNEININKLDDKEPGIGLDALSELSAVNFARKDVDALRSSVNEMNTYCKRNGLMDSPKRLGVIYYEVSLKDMIGDYSGCQDVLAIGRELAAGMDPAGKDGAYVDRFAYIDSYLSAKYHTWRRDYTAASTSLVKALTETVKSDHIGVDELFSLLFLDVDILVAQDRLEDAYATIEKLGDIIHENYPNGSPVEMEYLSIVGRLNAINNLLPEEKRCSNRYTRRDFLHYLYGVKMLAEKIYGKDTANPIVSKVNLELARAYANSAIHERKIADELRPLVQTLGPVLLESSRPQYNKWHPHDSLAKSHTKRARRLYKSELEHLRTYLHDNFLSLSEYERTSFTRQMVSLCEEIYSFGNFDAKDDDTRKMVYDACLLDKSMLLSFSRSITQLVHKSGNQELISMNDRLLAVRAELVEREQKGDYSESVSLRKEASELEYGLQTKLAGYGDPAEFMHTNYKSVQDKLGKKDVAVEFYSYRDRFGSGSTVCDRMAVLRSGKDPEIFTVNFPFIPEGVDLNESMMKDMYGTVWKPLVDKKKIRPESTVYFAPAGRWSTMPLEYLTGPKGPMSDYCNMVRLTTTRSLPENGTLNNSTVPVLVGGLDYQLGGEEMKMVASEIKEAQATMRSATQNKPFEALENSELEIESIASSLSGIGMSSFMLKGETGIEESFKNLSGKGHGLIHIATHGYYQAPEELKLSDGAIPSELFERSFDWSGLAFSGANRFWVGNETQEGVDDGLLTAREIALMDLHDTDMVVLSACESGLGGISSEGIFGLQRGFKLAGVNTLVMSLWKVPDEASNAIMTAFYDRLVQGDNKRTAFREAQKAVRQKSFGDGKKGSDPSIWGAFVILD